MTCRFLLVPLVLATAAARGGDPSFSDPANPALPPAYAVGFADRSPDLDVLPGFRNPPPGFGTVPFFWWLGDPLTKERLGWILDQMDGMGVSGYQINYAHSDQGGRSYGLTYPSEPPLFSDDWWDLAGWFMQAAKQQGAGISLSDYTLGFGQGWFVDELLRKHPEVRGQQLRMDNDGRVTAETVPWSLNPMHPQSGKWYCEEFFGQFERRFPGEGGQGLNFFFSDELGFGVSGRLWSAQFAEEFQRRKGYDLTPELPALFRDIGPRTPKVRLDYNDVLVALSEESFFKPVFDWHQQRGMIMGCDHGGRGRDVLEFGDYYRTQRWNQGPGSDQPHLGKDLIKAKIAASIAHLYERPRVWLEGFYGSGWGTTSAGVVDATFANYVMGYNLLGIHGMYYSTHGGWWEWAPPDNTFRMPYWRHLRGFMECQQRLAYLLSQGHHRCDVAILYPVAPMAAGMDGPEAVRTAFQLGETLYGHGIDFDFIDFESVARSRVEEKELRVAGECYRVLVLPAMKAVRWSTIQKAANFARAGGVVVALGALPEASDRAGRDDPELEALVEQTFGRHAGTPSPVSGTRAGVRGQSNAHVLADADQVVALVGAAFPRDYEGPGAIQHRRIGPRDLYAIYNAPKDAECFFRATGRVERWDPWTGMTHLLAVTSQTDHGTKLKLPLTEEEIQLIVFTPGEPVFGESPISDLKSQIVLDGPWEFELQPTLDNRFGDFHWPPTPTLVGAEARRMNYAEETRADPGWQVPSFDDSTWRTVTCDFGPRFWKLGPLPDGAEAEAALAGLREIDAARPVEIAGRNYCWEPYEFSWRYGIENDCGHQGYHGLKEQVSDDLIGLGAIRHGHPACRRAPEEGGTRYYLWTSVQAPNTGTFPISRGGQQPAQAWLNGAPLDLKQRQATLEAGPNPLLLRYDNIGRGWIVFGAADPAGADEVEEDAVFPTAANWIWWPNETEDVATRYFRRAIELPAGVESARLRITCDNSYRVSVNGREVGSGSNWARVQEYDVTALLKPGAILVEVEARNEGGEGALIADLLVRDEHGTEIRMGTDAQWQAASSREDPDWAPAHVVAPFAGSLWAKHPLGPPRLDETPQSAEAATSGLPWNRDLSSRWYRNPNILPFDTRPQTTKPAGWYRFVAPPGLRALTIPVREAVRVWVDGREQEVRPSGDNASVVVGAPSRRPVVVALRVEQRRGEYGGAAFRDYLRLDCGAGELPAGDWSKAGVLETYSGGAWYRKAFDLPMDAAHGIVTLDLGSVATSAEVRVNGTAAGIKVAPPWTLDITRFVEAGENRIEVLVCNTLANHYVTIPTHYRGATVSGLLGPVRIELR
ncbi:MAG: hypothetical protein H7A45_19530 [Verrucomicrobiales bacterium]|nr:hypothetical protein [Verrucomicrobiales bacterium]